MFKKKKSIDKWKKEYTIFSILILFTMLFVWLLSIIYSLNIIFYVIIFILFLLELGLLIIDDKKSKKLDK